MKRILLVDDDKSVLKMLQAWMTGAGHDVVAFSDFNAAKHYLSLNRPEVILTDVRLGAFNGLHLIVVAKLACPDARAVVLTAFDDDAIRAEAARIGARYLIKPVTVDELLTAVD